MNQCQTDKQTTMGPRSSDALVTICYNRQADKPPDFDRKQFVRWNGETMKREIEVYGASRHARRDTSLAYEVWREEEKCDRMIRKWWETWWKNVKNISFESCMRNSCGRWGAPCRCVTWCGRWSRPRCNGVIPRPVWCVCRGPLRAGRAAATENQNNTVPSVPSPIWDGTCFKPVSNLRSRMRRSLLEVGTSFACLSASKCDASVTKTLVTEVGWAAAVASSEVMFRGYTMLHSQMFSGCPSYFVVLFFPPMFPVSLSFERPVLNWINKYCKKWVQLGNGHAKRRLKDI